MGEYRSTKVECATYYDGNIWYISGDMPFLYCMNTISNKTERLIQIAPFANRCPFLYTSMVYADNKLFMFPWDDNRIAVYSIEESKLEYIEIDEEISKHSFSGAFVIDNYVYSLCATLPLVLRIRIDNYCVEYCEICIENETGSRYFFGGAAVVDEGKLLFSARNSNKLIQVDTESFESLVFDLQTNCTTFLGIGCIDNLYVCAPEHAGDSLIYVDRMINVIREVKTSGNPDYPINIYVDNDKEILLSLDPELEVPGYEVLNCTHTVETFEGGFLTYDKDRKKIIIYHDGGKIDTYDMRIEVEREVVKQWVNTCVIEENYLMIDDYVEAI